MDLMSKEETLYYIRDVLKIPVTELPCLSSPSLSAKEKLTFLENLLQAYLEREPFQNITLMSDEVKNRHRPSWDEIKSNMFLSRGGLCYWHNTFMYVLLSALGCDVSMAHSTVSGFDRDNHVVVLVHDLFTPGDFHIVDVGIGCYIPRPIPLDFAVESPVYRDSNLTYKFVKEGETKIAMLNTASNDAKSSTANQSEQEPKKDENVSAEASEDKVTEAPAEVEEFEWEELLCFNPLEQYKNLEQFFPCFDICFTDVTKLPFHTSPRAMHWSGGKFVGIVNSKLLEEKEEGKLTKTEIIKNVAHDNSTSTNQDLDPLLQAYKKYFPQFPSDMVLVALNHWRSSQLATDNPSHVDY